MKWLLLTIGILAVVAILGTGVGMVGVVHYCTPPIGHITPMICKTPTPPGMPILHPNYH